jgi:hypothetical protein
LALNDSTSDSIRRQYERHGATNYYRAFAGDYANPHGLQIRDAISLARGRWPLDLSNVFDLAAGSGEATLALLELGAAKIDACDPYLFEQYHRRTGQPAERFSFEDIAAGALADRRYSLVVCSFALHLAEASRLPGICQQLSLIAPAMLILTPHKRPEVRREWGWTPEDEFVWARVRCRFYRAQETHF